VRCPDEEHKKVRFNAEAAEEERREERPARNGAAAGRLYTTFADQARVFSSVRTRDRGRPTTLK